MQTEVRLELSELLQAAIAGSLRRIDAIRHGRVQKNNRGSGGEWQQDIEGAAAEMAVAKFLNLYFPGKGQLRADDVGVNTGIQVRASEYDQARLILHPDDPDDATFYLVTGRMGIYVIRGWLVGRLGKRDEYWTDPTGNGRPAYFVPQSALIGFDNHG